MNLSFSYFNNDQQKELDYLNSLKPSETCWCGWFPIGKCNTPNPCPKNATMEMRIKETCLCGGYPSKPGYKLNHRNGCTHK